MEKLEPGDIIIMSGNKKVEIVDQFFQNYYVFHFKQQRL